MKVGANSYKTIWLSEDEKSVKIIDQTKLPHEFVVQSLNCPFQIEKAIKDMQVRGAGLIGAAAGYGMYLATLLSEKENYDYLPYIGKVLTATRPTAINLKWAVDKQLKATSGGRTLEEKRKIAKETANQIAYEDVENCRNIGKHGLSLIKKIYDEKGKVNILTHCNAGWLAFVDYGSATSPIYAAKKAGIPVFVYVSETRPRNQGANLTAWELGEELIPHAVISDNAGGYLMQQKLIDMVIVGSDRTTYTGDVTNKIGTYLKALAAKENEVPFYVALPSSSIDWNLKFGKEVPIEERGGDEIKFVKGMTEPKNGKPREIINVRITPNSSRAINYAFDVTPRDLVTKLITERGICDANEKEILKLFPEKNDGRNR